jgi:hypothetical protein
MHQVGTTLAFDCKLLPNFEQTLYGEHLSTVRDYR